MAKNTLSIKYTSEGLKETVQGLNQVGSAFEQALKNAQESVEQAKRNVKAAQGDLSLNIPVNDRALGESKIQLERAQKQLQSVVSNAFGQLGVRSQSSIETQKRQLISAFEAIKQSGVASAGDIANAQTQLKIKLKELDQQLDKTNNGFTIFKGIVANVASSAIIGGFQSLLGVVQNLGMGIVGLGQKSIATFMGFDSAIKQFEAISGSTKEQLKSVKDEANKLGIETSKTPAEIAQAATELAKAGFSAEQVVQSLGGIVKASEASQESLQRTGEIIGATLNQFQLPASDSKRIADILAAASNASAASITGLGDGLKYVGAIAGSSGQSLEDMVVVLSLLSNAGLDASQTGTNFRSALVAIQKATAGMTVETEGGSEALKKKTAMLKELGVEFRDNTGKMRPFVQLLPELSKRFKELAPDRRELIAYTLFGTEGANAIIPLIGQVDTKLKGLVETIQNAQQGEGAATTTANKLMQGLDGALDQLNSSFEVLLQNIGGALAPAAEVLVRATTDWVNELVKSTSLTAELQKTSEEFSKWFSQNPQIAESLNKALAEGVAVAFQSVTDLAKQLLDYLQKNPTAIADAVKSMGFLIKAMGDFLGLIGKAIQGWERIAELTQQAGSFLTGKGGTVEQISREQIRRAYGEQGVALFDQKVADLDKPRLGGNFLNIIPGAKDKAIKEVVVELLGNGKKYGLTATAPSLPAPATGSGVTGGVSNQMFFPTARGSIGTSPGQKFTAPRDGGRRRHNGIDITATQGEPVHAVVGGRITEIRVLDPVVGSHGIFIQGADGNTWTYNHVVPVQGLKVGATVGNGQQIAKVSADDKLSQGAHLDIKVKNAAGNYFDPTSLLSQLPRPTPSNLQRAQSTAQIQPAQPAIATGGTPTGPAKTVKASFYGGPSDPTRWHGRKTASGEVYDENALTVAVPYRSKTDKKPSIPFGTQLAVTNPANGKQVVVRVTDTGNFGTDAQYGGRGLDLSYAAAKALGTVQAGVAPVSYRILGATATTATVSKEQEELEKKQERARVQAEKIREQFRTTTDRQEIAKLKEKHATILEEMTSQKKSEYLIQWQTLQQQNELAELEYKQALKRLKEQRTEKQKAIKAGLEEIPNADRDLSLDIQTLTADRARERAQFKRQANAINSGELERRQRWDIDNQLEAGKAAIAVGRQNLELQRKQLSTALELGSINQETYLTREKAIIQEESLLKIAENRNEITRLRALLEKDLAADTERAGINRQLNALETENKLIQETNQLDLQQIDHRLQQLKISEEQAKTSREIDRLSTRRILAERANRLEEARDLSLAEIDLQYLQQKAAIEADITDQKERQAELDLAEAQRNQAMRETELNYINQKNALEAGNQQRANQISDLQAGLEWNPFEASRLQEEAANRNAEADYSASIEDIRQRYGDNFEDNPQAVLEAQDAANILTLTLRQIDRQFRDLSESIGMGLAGAFDSFFEALFRGEDALTAFAQSLASTLADIGQQLISSGIKSALGGIFGFAEGGYTGNGGKYQPAGIVHAGEYVLNQTTTQRLGTKLLDRLNTGQLSGYFAGGLVTADRLLQGLGSNLPSISLPNSPAMATVPVSTTNTVTVNINDQNSRFYTQSRTLARELAEKLRG